LRLVSIMPKDEHRAATGYYQEALEFNVRSASQLQRTIMKLD
jgi:hypothetical protein